MRPKVKELWIGLRPSPAWVYTMRVSLAFAIAIYVAVAASWFIPDRRIESRLKA